MAKGGGAGSANPVRPVRHLHAQSSAYGDPIPIVFGETIVPGNIVWADFFKSHKLPTGSVSGKKSGGFAGIVSYVYTVSCMLCLGEGGTPSATAPQGTDTLTLGLMRPGGQVVSVVDAKTPSTGTPDDYSPGGKAATQNLNGVEPGVKRAKRVRYAGTGKFGKFRGARFHDWGPVSERYVTLPNWWTIGSPTLVDDVYEAFPGGEQADKMAAAGTPTYAPEQYNGFAVVANQNMNLGANASIPNWVFPFRGLEQFWQTENVAPVGPEIRDAAPDRVLANLFLDPKHGAGWTLLAWLLSGYNGALSDPLTSPFWYDNAGSWGNYCRALGLLISPRLDSAQPFQQWIDDLALLTDTAVVWSEGQLKMIPWGDAPSSRDISDGSYTYTPITDATSTVPGANVAIRAYLTADDFLDGTTSRDGVIQATRLSVIPNEQTGPGYFNVVRVEFENRLNGYVKQTVEAKDEAAVQTYGLVARDPFTAPAITRVEVAIDVALRILQRYSQKRVTYKFTIGWWHMLWEPMDVLALPGELIDAAMAGQWIPVRLTVIAENENGNLECEADPFPRLIPAGPPGPEPEPMDEVDLEDSGGVIVGGWFTTNGNADDSWNPQSENPTGENSGSDWWAGATYLPSYAPEPEGIVLTSWAVTCTKKDVGTQGFDFRDCWYRLRIVIDDEPQTELELIFDTRADVGVTKIATGSLRVPAGSRWCVELLRLDYGGVPYPSPPPNPPNVTGFPLAFNWTFAYEPGDV